MNTANKQAHAMYKAITNELKSRKDNSPRAFLTCTTEQLQELKNRLHAILAV